MARVAVIGSGISGLTAAHYLSRRHDATLFEADARPGGHTHTHDIELDGKTIRVDTGFIVHNDRTYPNFIRLLEELGCETIPTEMSFSVKTDKLEYNGHSLNSLFAQRSNLLRPSFLSMVRDILRFNREARELHGNECSLSIGDYLDQHRYSKAFQDYYLLPMAAAIWSTGREPIRAFPVSSLVRFFVNHGLMNLKDRPEWRVLRYGSDDYVGRILNRLEDVRLGTPVRGIDRTPDAVAVQTDSGTENFDQIVIATHSDQALNMLNAPTDLERDILGAIRYTPNSVKLHTDDSVMPRRKLAWASWNYHISEQTRKATLTYDMNRLQHLPIQTPLLVTLNDNDRIHPDHVIREINYSHPFFDAPMVQAQSRWRELAGKNRTWFAGAYWLNGFHEDGVVSALRACKGLGAARC